jgi:hypothetical protein
LINKRERILVRYNDDIINAESWNTDLKKTVIPASPDSDEIEGHHNNTIPKACIPAAVNLSASRCAQEINHTPDSEPLKTWPSEVKEAESIPGEQPADENSQVSNPDIIRISKMAVSHVSTYESRNRTNRRRKRGMFLLSGLITGLFSRSRNLK